MVTVPGNSLSPPVVLKYYAYEATTTFGFLAPVYVLYHLDSGLSYAQIGILGSVAAGAAVAGELPTGYLGDRIGRRNCLIVGSALFVASSVGFVVAGSFPAFVALWILWGLAGAFQSGSADAWLYDALDDGEEAYTRVRGRGGSIDLWVTAGSMLVAGLLYELDPRLPFLATGALAALSIPVVLAFPGTAAAPDDGEQITALEALPAVREQLTAPPLRSVVLYAALFFGIVGAAEEFVQPIATRALALPRFALGPLYAGITAVAAVASYYADAIETRLSTRGALLVVPVGTGLLFVAPALAAVAAVPMFVARKAAPAALTPIVNGVVNDHTDSANRATALSATSLVYALVGLPLGPLAGVAADRAGLLPAMALLGGGFLAGASLFYGREPPDGAAAMSGRSTD